MSMFYCDACDDLCDADDGCEDRPGNKLICADCAAEEEAEAELADAEDADTLRLANPLEPGFRRIG